MGLYDIPSEGNYHLRKRPQPLPAQMWKDGIIQTYQGEVLEKIKGPAHVVQGDHQFKKKYATHIDIWGNWK